jgi:hypothetical protein
MEEGIYVALIAAATGVDGVKQTKFFEEFGEELKTTIGHLNKSYEILSPRNKEKDLWFVTNTKPL